MMGNKRNQPKCGPKMKSDGEKKLYCRKVGGVLKNDIKSKGESRSEYKGKAPVIHI